MSDAELSRELALALGYAPESVRVPFGVICEVFRTAKPKHYLDPTREWNEPSDDWQAFDYRDPSVVVPLIKWLMDEHGATFQPSVTGEPVSIRLAYGMGGRTVADTLEEAVARAVIAVRKG